MGENSPPLVFLSVCKRWREIAMSSSTLWSTLNVDACDLKAVRIMFRWLQFANKQPLSITFFAKWHCTMADLAIAILLEHQAYWFEVDIHWGLGDAAPLLTNPFTSNNAPLLQRFAITTNLQDSDELENKVDARLSKLLTGSTNLRTFEWSLQHNMDPGEFPIRLADIPFNNLCHLKLGCRMAFSYCLDILRRTPLLESCVLIHVEDERVHASLGIVQLPKLSSLCVKTTCDMSDFLDALDLPSLQRLQLVFRKYESDDVDDLEADQDEFADWPHAAFLSFLQRSACPLKELTLATSVVEDQLLEYLPLVSPALETLSLTGTLGWACIDQRAITELTILPGSSTAVLCPKLRALTLDNCFADTLNDNSVADMIQSRLLHTAAAGDGRPLKVFLAAYTPFLDSEDWRRLEVLRLRFGRTAKLTFAKLDEM
ncbi:hypothetical protein HWV62_34593 [Athelia sp. TMB]|nr:hypothetical protein HWV62_34593 [Athelia sp. TMB]